MEKLEVNGVKYHKWFVLFLFVCFVLFCFVFSKRKKYEKREDTCEIDFHGFFFFKKNFVFTGVSAAASVKRCLLRVARRCVTGVFCARPTLISQRYMKCISKRKIIVLLKYIYIFLAQPMTDDISERDPMDT